MGVAIGDVFEQTVRKYPQKEAVYDTENDRRFSYAAWDVEVNRLANAFVQAGVRKGDRVSTFLYNTFEFVTTFFACAKMGAILNPINYRLKSNELAYILQDAEPKILLFEHALEGEVASIASDFPGVSFWSIDEKPPAYAQSYEEKKQKAPATPVQAMISEDDLYAIMYTSGTTGRPKGVMHRHRDVVEQSLVVIAAMNYTDKDRGLIMAPMFHCAELHCGFFARVHAGASQVLMHHFEVKRAIQLVQDEQITTIFAVPTMWKRILQEHRAKATLSSLRTGMYGGEPMPTSLVHACHDILGVRLTQAYGMTEMGPTVAFLMNDDQLSKAGSAGRACLNHEIRVVRPRANEPSDPEDLLGAGEIGEIVIKGPSVMAGYYRNPKATEQALYKGWYHSGDLGYFDEDGYLWIADRADHMIVSGGENIYPREVEDALYEHPAIQEVAVIGEPDVHWGQTVVAFVVKKNEQVTADELDAFCKSSSKLANYKRPRRYVFVEELPRNTSGKLQKFRLKEALGTGGLRQEREEQLEQQVEQQIE